VGDNPAMQSEGEVNSERRLIINIFRYSVPVYPFDLVYEVSI